MDEQSNYRKISPTTFIAIVIELILIIITISMAINLLKPDNSVNESSQYSNANIANFRQEISSIDRNGLIDIQFSIYDIVWLNNKDIKSTGLINATIRANSVEKNNFKEDGIYQIYFILDLPELAQSYQVNHLYSTAKGYNTNLPIEYRTMIYCPEESQKIYTNQTCIDRYAGQAEEIIQSFDLN